MPPEAALAQPSPSIVPPAPAAAPHAFTLRPFPKIPPRVLVIGSSTGGPQALTVGHVRLGAVIDHAPVLITQHMPPTFTTILAEHLGRATGREVREAQDGELVRAGHIYVAPGGQHMRVARRDGNAVIVLDDSAPINFCKPAVDALFASAAEIWGSWVLGVILTGMGSDGTAGAGDIVASGGAVIAQDEASSMVWGMPGAAAEAGFCSAVLPLHDHRAESRAAVCGRKAMTPNDYDYLRKMLKQRSGLMLSAEKHYLVESRLMPVARKAGLATLTELVQKLKAANAEALIVEVVEAMTTNETFFFRDQIPFEHFRDFILPALLAARASAQTDPDLVRGRLRRPGALFAGDDACRDARQARQLPRRDPGD